MTCPPFGSTVLRLCDLPDGFDEPSQVSRVSTDGTVARFIGDEEAHLFCHPTNLAFRDGTLFTANLGRWYKTAVDTDVEGLPLPVNA